MDFVKRNVKLIGVAGCLLAIIGTFLPFASITVEAYGYSQSESVRFIEGDGVFVIILAVVAGFMLFGKALIGLRISFIRFDKIVKFWWGALVPLAVALGITFYDASEIDTVESSYMGLSADISFGIGMYLIVLGLLVAIASVIFDKFVAKNDAAN